jgi:hypothetical protein
MIIKLDSTHVSLVNDFLNDAQPTEQILNADKIYEKIVSNDNYGGFAFLKDKKVTNIIFYRKITETNSAVLDIIWSRKNCSFISDGGIELYNAFLEYLISNNIYSYYTFSEKDRSARFEKVFSKLVEKRNCYDCYIEEIIPANHFSKYHLHFWFLMNGTLRNYDTAVRKYVLKNELRSKTI